MNPDGDDDVSVPEAPSGAAAAKGGVGFDAKWDKDALKWIAHNVGIDLVHIPSGSNENKRKGEPFEVELNPKRPAVPGVSVVGRVEAAKTDDDGFEEWPARTYDDDLRV
jgi:hypothetical protein